MDGFREIGKYLRNIQDNASLALKREVPLQVSTERIRDVFDSTHPVIASIDTPPAMKRVMMNLNFGRRLPSLGCCGDCMCGSTESYTSDSLISGSIYLSQPYVAGSTIVYLDGARSTDYVESNPDTGQLTIFAPFAGIVISYVYSTGNCTELCLPNAFDCVGFSLGGLTRLFSDSFNKPNSYSTSGGCGSWVSSGALHTPILINASGGYANISALAQVGGGFVSGGTWEIVVAMNLSGSHNGISGLNNTPLIFDSLATSGSIAYDQFNNTLHLNVTAKTYINYLTENFGNLFAFTTDSSTGKNSADVDASPFIGKACYFRLAQTYLGDITATLTAAEDLSSSVSVTLNFSDFPQDTIDFYSQPPYSLMDYGIYYPSIAYASISVNQVAYVTIGGALDDGDWNLTGMGPGGIAPVFKGYWCNITDGVDYRFQFCSTESNGTSTITEIGNTLPRSQAWLSFPTKFDTSAPLPARIITYEENMGGMDLRSFGTPKKVRIRGELCLTYVNPGDLELLEGPVIIDIYQIKYGFGPIGFNGSQGFYPFGEPVASFPVFASTQQALYGNYVDFTIETEEQYIVWGMTMRDIEHRIAILTIFEPGGFLFPNNHYITLFWKRMWTSVEENHQCTATTCCESGIIDGYPVVTT